MFTIRRLSIFSLLLATAVSTDGLVKEARAQSRSSSYVPNSYQDFPFNQGSLFYQYRGPGSKKVRTTPRRTVVPGTTVTQQVVPQQVVQPQYVPQQYQQVAPQQYQQVAPQQYYYYYTPQVQGGYVQQAPRYYYPAGYGAR